MPFYHFHVRGGGIDFVDEAGADCRDDAQALAQAQWIARETLLDAIGDARIPRRAVVEVSDRSGRAHFVVPVALALPAYLLAELTERAVAERRSL